MSSTKKSYLIEAALSIVADTGFKVFPTTDKKPVWSNEDLGLSAGEGSYKIATTDARQIKKLFERGAQVSVPMRVNGLVAIDVDLYKGGEVEQWHEANRYWLEGTRTHRSGNGGLHYIFKADPELRLPGQLMEGVDVKWNGYIVWPPQDGYEVIDDADYRELPEDEMSAAMRAKGGTGNLRGADAMYNSATDTELYGDIISGASYHPAMQTLTMRYANRRQPAEISLELLREAMDLVAIKDDRWHDRYSKIEPLVTSAIAKLENERSATDEETAAVMQGTPLMKMGLDNFSKPTLEEIRAEVSAEKTQQPSAPSTPPGLVGEIAAYHDMKSRHVTPQYGVVAGLISVSALLGNRYVVDMPKYDTNTNLFVAMLGPTGSGKELPRTIVSEVLTIGGMQDTVKDVVSEPAFHAALNHDARMTWMPDEFGKLLRNIGHSAAHHTSGMLKFAMQAYGIHNGGMIPAKVYSNAKDAKPAIVSPYVVAMATTTRSSFEQVMSEDFIADGFLNRLLMVEEPQSVMGKVNGTSKAKLSDDVRARIAALADNGALETSRAEGRSLPHPMPIAVSSDALALFEAFDDETTRVLATTNDPAKRELMPRLHENAIRVAGVLACGDGDPLSPVLEEEHAAWAITFVRKSLAAMIEFTLDMGGTEFDKDRRRVLEFIREHGEMGVTARDITRRFKLQARDRDAVIEMLEHGAYIAEVNTASGITKQRVIRYVAV